MVTLTSDIIRDGYRESNLIAISEEPTGAQRQEGLRLLNRLLLSVFGYDEGETFQPYYLGQNNISKPAGFPYHDPYYNLQNWFVPNNTRLVLNLTESKTVWLNPSPQDGDRFAVLDNSGNLVTYPLIVNGNGHKIEGADSQTYDTNGLGREFMYRADKGNWQVVNPLVETDEWPFPPEFDDMFSISLALRLNPRNQIQLANESMVALRRSMSQFKARYRQTNPFPSELGLLITPGIMYSNTAYFSDPGNAAFNSGYPSWGFRTWQ